MVIKIVVMFMPEIKFIDEVLAPTEEFTISYKGRNPFLIMTVILPLLREILKVSSTNLFEDDVRWDSFAEPKTFYGMWRGYMPGDRWTRTLIRVFAQGTKDKENYGDVTIRIRGYLITKFEYNYSISKAWWLLYNYSFYWRQRRAYLDYARDMIHKLKEEIQAAYNILREE